MSHSRTKAKKDFLDKLKTALENEESILNALPDDERLVEKEQKEQKRNTISIKFTATLESFVHNVNEKHRHRTNVEKLEELIAREKALLLEQAALEQAALEQKRPEPPKPSLTIRYSRGVITPTQPIITPDEYHWEMQSNVSCHRTSWSQIGETGDNYIRPSLSSGEVRLSYKDGDLVSNKIKLDSVIKRQAASAKRRQYRFERDDPAFIQRCRGVAGRIQRMLKPGRLISDANFATRVFQDRVIQLPQHLESDADNGDATYGTLGLKSMTLYIMELCESGTTDDDDYVHMIEFVEPTIYLNPRGLHDALTDIYKGKEITLRLPIDGRVDEKTNGEEDVLEQTRRQGILDRKKRQAARMKRAAKLEADKLKAEERRAAAELLRQQREKQDRQRQADREVEEARQRQLELERIERERQAELARIAEEERLVEEERQADLERIRKEQEEADTKAAEEAAERERERKRLQRQAEIAAVDHEYPLPDNFVGFIKSYDTKEEGVADIGPSEWFKAKANDKIYAKSASGKSTRASAIERANEGGWYEKATLDKEAAAAAATVLAAEEARLAKEKREAEEEAEADRQRLEQERLQKEAEATAERERLEQERLQKEAEAAAERERIAKEAADAEAAARQAKIDTLRSDEDAVKFIEYVFTTYDINGNNEIDEVELVKAYFAGKTKVKAGAGRALIDENDQDGNGTINEEEFIDWCAVSGVMDDDAWQTAARDFKERQAALASGEQKSSPGLMMLEENTYKTLLVKNNKPYLIGEVKDILEKIGVSTEWSADNNVKELTEEVSAVFSNELTAFIKNVGAEGWLNWGDIIRMSRTPDVRIFYVPEDPSKEFTVAPVGRRDPTLRSINAKAICTIQVEENTFKADDGSISERKVFVLKDIATRVLGLGAKFLFAKALSECRKDNADVSMVITQPFDDAALATRVKRFINKWGFKHLETDRPPPTMVGGLFTLDSDGEDLLPPKPGDLTAMIQNMSDNWVSSDEELDFAEQSENESLEFAASSSLDTDSDMDFAQSSERGELNSEGSSLDKVVVSSGMEFAESSSAETDSDMEFAETSDKTSSGLEFAESSAVDSD